MTEADSSTSLADVFAAHREREWYFVRPGGNWGDRLIYSGAASLGRRLGLRWTDLDHAGMIAAPPPAGACIYLHGGGGLNPWGSRRAFANLQRALQVPDAVVVQGPQTCDTESPETPALFAAALAAPKAGEIHFFTREPVSARFLAPLLPADVRLHVDQDTAFHLTTAQVLALAELAELPRGRYTLLVAREDDEAPPALPGAAGRAVRMDPAYYASSLSHWLRIHAFANHIVSNRLHSAIAGTLLGRPVDLLAGRYHKNRSIWEFSLRQRGVRWRPPPEGLSPPAAPAFPWLPQRLAQSWKVQRALFRLRGVPAR